MSTRHASEPPKPISREGLVEAPPRHIVNEALSSRAWQLATLVMPILLTTWLTFWVSQKETNIKQDIDKQSQLLSQQVQLSEELYKRRFDTYDKLYGQLVSINLILQEQADSNAWSKIAADEATHFNDLYNSSKLHLSPRVSELSYGAWLASIRGDGPLLSKNLDAMESQMKQELDNWMLAEKGEMGTNTASSTSSKTKKSKPKTGSSQ